MKNTPLKYPNQKQSFFFSYLGVFILFLPILFYAKNTQLSQIGSLLLILCYLFALIDNLRTPPLFVLNGQTVIFMGMILFYTISLLLSQNLKNLYSFTLCLGGLYILHYFTQVNFNLKAQQIFYKYSLILLMALVPLGIYLGLNGGISIFAGYNDYFNRVIFKLMLPLSFFLVICTKRKYLIWFSLAMVYWLMIERTSAIITLIILGTYYFFHAAPDNQKRSKRVFWILITTLFLFIVVYVGIFETEFGFKLNVLTRDLTGKNLFSGRQTIWAAAFKAILKKPFFGYGFDSSVLLQYGIEMSPHNAYIYILLQTGVVGLSLFLAFLYSIWTSLVRSSTDLSKVSLSYFLALLIFMNFELTLIANTMVLGLYYTLTVALGISVKQEITEEH